MPANGELMMNANACFLVLCSLLAPLGCAGSDKREEQPTSGRGGGGAAATGGQGDSGAYANSGGGGGGSKAGAGAPTPPPEMPRELGDPDGIYCQSNFNDPPAQTCSAGSRCCPGDTVNENDPVCIADAGKCAACDSVTCAQLLCDGPEDCSSGTFCCYSQRTCRGESEDCTAASAAFESSAFMSVECKARCVGDQRDPDHGAVVCKDDRDCPGRYVAGRCRPLMAGTLPYGIKVCSEP